MGLTNAQKRKQQKKHNRRKSIEKNRNIKLNSGEKKYSLDVFFKGKWIYGFRQFNNIRQVERYRDETEVARKKGIEIIAGRVVSLLTGKVILEVAASNPVSDADPKDKSTEVVGPEAAKEILTAE